jgi:transcriptional regulator with XRE-family HTH domain
MDIKEMLLCLRKKGFTEQGIALTANISQSTVSRLLSGKIRQPRFDVAIKIKTIYQQYCQ